MFPGTINMNHITCQFAGDDPAVQREAVDLLARCFEVWAERKVTFKGRFPFREQSFVARDHAGEVVGHLGIIPFDLRSGKGDTISMAGVASVAVAPEYRKLGIAGMLCQQAAIWAEKNHFAAMPLYTSAFRVYEKNHWQMADSNGCLLKNPFPQRSSAGWKSGAELSCDEQNFIRKLYDQRHDVAGWVVRTEDPYDAVSWQRLFSKPGYSWYIHDSGYMLSADGTLAEVCGRIPVTCAGMEFAFFAKHDPACAELISAGWSDVSAEYPQPPCWEGEAVMTRIITPGMLPENLFFPLPHKF